MRRRRRSRLGRDAPSSPLPPTQGCAAVGGPVLAGAVTPSLLLPAPGCDAIAAPGLRRYGYPKPRRRCSLGDGRGRRGGRGGGGGDGEERRERGRAAAGVGDWRRQEGEDVIGFCGGGGRCVCWAGPGFFVGPDKFAVCSTLNTRQKCYFFSFLHI